MLQGRVRRGATENDRPGSALDPFELLEDFVHLRPISERRAPALVADYAFSIDEERRRAIADLDVDAHLERHAVGGAYGEGRIGQQRIVQVVRSEPGLLEQGSRRPDFMRIDRDQFRAALANLTQPVAQLRELTMTDGSGVAIDEDQHDRAHAAEIAEFHPFSLGGGQLKVGRRLPHDGRING